MKTIRSYWFEDFSKKEDYDKFIRYMLKESDAFSLVYFRYCENERVKKSVKEVKALLRPFVIDSWNGNEWASMITLNENGHIYKITLYDADERAFDGLSKANCLFEWHYPKFPMDICFFKDDYAWFVTSAHENYAILYTNSQEDCATLESLGALFSYNETVDFATDLFFEKRLTERKSKTGNGSPS